MDCKTYLDWLVTIGTIPPHVVNCERYIEDKTDIAALNAWVKRRKDENS